MIIRNVYRKYEYRPAKALCVVYRIYFMLHRPDERTMAELFDLSHTLRRERELSTGSAAGKIDSSDNRETNSMGAVTTHSYVLPTGKGSDMQNKSFGSGVDVNKQV